MIPSVDFRAPVETLIPGVRGKVLGALARTEAPLTMRTVARLAGVSVNRAVVVLNELTDLGVVTREEVGAAAHVQLDRENETAKIVLQLADLRARVLGQLRASATTLDPPPVSLVIFGSFARGEATATSDIDVLAVRPAAIGPDATLWDQNLSTWAEQASTVAGNAVNLVVVDEEEITRLVRSRRGVWKKAADEGIVLCGRELSGPTP